MKQFKYFLLIAAVALSTIGCHKEVTVSFETTTQELDAQGGTIEVGLKSNGGWTIESTAEWLSITPLSGTGDATLTITAEANPIEEPRMAEVRAISKDNASALTLTQGAGVVAQYINVTPREILCDSEGGEFVIELSTNINWFITTPTWITCSPAEGSGDARITVTVSRVEEDLYEDREAEVFIGNLSVFEKVHVVQTVEPVLGIELTPNNIGFVCTGETKTVAVTTEDGWTASVEDDWVTLSQTEGQGDAEISVTVGENPIYVDRIAIVLFTTTGGVQTILTVRQDASPDPHFLEVSPLEFVFEKEGGEKSITIGCDTDWSFDLDCDWLSLSQLSGTGNATVVLTAEPNLLTEPRSARCYIRSGELLYALTVNQAAGDIPIEAVFEPDTLWVPYTGGLQHVQLTSNTSWNLQFSSWISIFTATSGEGDASFDLIIDSNTSSEGRTGYMNALHNGQVIGTLVVIQEGKIDILETDAVQLDVRPEGGDYEIHVTANQGWIVESSDSWIHCDPHSGFGNGSFTISVDALPGARPREGSVKVTGETGSEVVITVSQH